MKRHPTCSDAVCEVGGHLTGGCSASQEIGCCDSCGSHDLPFWEHFLDHHV